MAVVMLYFMFQGILRLGLTLLVPVDLSIAGLGLGFYYLSKKKGFFEKLRLPFMLLLFTSCIFFWIRLGGYNGPAAFAGLVICMVSILISPAGQRRRYFAASFLIITTLVVLQISSPNLVSSYSASWDTLPINYLIFVFAALLISYYIKSQFDQERRKVVKQNVRLKSLNERLSSTLNEKQEVINRLKEAQEQLIESEKMASIGRFTAGVAHELNNPLNFVGGSVLPIQKNLDELLKGLPINLKEQFATNLDEIKFLLENIEDGTDQARLIMENLLRLSPRSADTSVSEPVDLTDLVKNVSFFVERSNTDIVFNQKIEGNVRVSGNKTEFSQVLMNLLKNSVDAVRKTDQKVINISLKEHEGLAMVEIKDSGPGVPQNLQHRLFDPFFTTKPPGSGTGLGLSISYSIAKKNGGDLSFVPSNCGAHFCFKLPLDRKS